MSPLLVIMILAVAWELWHLVYKPKSRGPVWFWRMDGPTGRLVSADPREKLPVPSSALFAKGHRVKGTPDFVHEDPPGLLALLMGRLLGRQPAPPAHMPVEVKSASVRNFKNADWYQLMTYCFLLEENGHTVKRGRLKYANTVFSFPYGPAERQEVLRVLEEMRKAERETDMKVFARTRDSRCRRCEFPTLCF